MAIAGDPPSVDTPPSDLSADDIEMLKELEESIRASGMDSQDPPNSPDALLFCISCRICVFCRRCTNCSWT